MKTINFELSKRLNDLGLLDNIETEYVNITDWSIFERDGEPNPSTYDVLSEELLFNENISSTKYKTINDIINDENSLIEINYKTLTLEEAIEFFKKYAKQINLKIETTDYMSIWSIYGQTTPIFREKTLLEAIEKLLEYLLDNNLLGK